MSRNAIYCSALRMKTGELTGVLALATDVADCLLPRFIVPPQSERDDKQPLLFVVDRVPDFSKALSRHWRGRDALIDLTYLIDECGRDRIAEWLPSSFKRARQAGGRPVPMATLADLGASEVTAFASAIDHTEDLRFAISVPFDEMEGPEFRVALSAALNRLGITPTCCAVIADFSGAEFSDPRVVAPIITGALETFQEFGPWRHTIFQGSHFPSTNPAEPDGREVWPRHEWQAWKGAVHLDPATAVHLMFGDYAADCSKIAFGGGGGRAIPHYRYATEDAWVVERGARTGSDKDNMRRVCQRIVQGGNFAGAGFSAADEFILRTSQGGAPGNSTNWRQINTTHHITRVIADIAKVRGIAITEKRVDADDRQTSLVLL
ncbi:beta family protein [Sphingomonas faeni]|uniref:beta family protein n=1 Tax=Sphingomonas faeni TaxID=185950 RepID=UPI00334C9168